MICQFKCGDFELTVVTEQLSLNTRGEEDIIDITGMVSEAVNESGVKDGVVTIFVPGATGALTTIEYEPGLLMDFPRMLNRVAPRNLMYEHEKR